jgi:hypothetical protein
MRAKIAALPPDDAETAQLALTLGLQAFERKEVTIG